MKQINSNNTHGSTLLIVMGAVVLLAALLGTAASLNQNSKLLASRSTEVIDTTLAADTGMQRMFGEMDAILSIPGSLPNNVTFTTLYNKFNTNTAPANIFPVSQYRVLNYNVIPLTTNGAPANIPDSSIVDGKQFRFLGVVWVQSIQNPAVISKIQQEMQFIFRPLYQYAIFYNPDLEMFNGPAMVISGKVHANGGINQFNSGHLTFNGGVTSVNSVTNRGLAFSRGESRTTAATTRTYNSGPPSLTTIKKLPGTDVPTNSAFMGVNPNMSTNGAIELIQRPVLGNVNGTNFTRYGALTNAAEATDDPYAPILGVPLTDESQVNTRLFYKADLRILVDNARIPQFYTGTVDDTNTNGVLIPMLLTNTVVSTNGVTNLVVLTNQTYLTLLNSVTTTNRISDFRWAGGMTSNTGSAGITNIRTTEFDISRIVHTNNGSVHSNLTSYNTTNILGTTIVTNTTPIPDFNGLVYISNTEGSSSNKQGVVLRNGNYLPDKVINNGVTNINRINLGLSVVTDNPLYIIGDYNTGRTGNLVGSNNNPNNRDTTFNLTNSTSVGYTRRPASVMADAVTILSQNYISKMTNANYNTRTTPVTTVNTAILAGFVPSTISTNSPAHGFLSGGVHNFPRFLENWNNVKLVINGSLVNIYNSEQGTSPFYCNPGNGANGETPANISASSFAQYYSPPTRVWNFDVNYLDPTKLPPGTPMVRDFTLGQWAKLP